MYLIKYLPEPQAQRFDEANPKCPYPVNRAKFASNEIVKRRQLGSYNFWWKLHFPMPKCTRLESDLRLPLDHRTQSAHYINRRNNY